MIHTVSGQLGKALILYWDLLQWERDCVFEVVSEDLAFTFSALVPLCPGGVCAQGICVYSLDIVVKTILLLPVVTNKLHRLSELVYSFHAGLVQGFDLVVLIVVKGNLILGFVRSSFVVSVILKHFSAPPALDISNLLAAQNRFRLCLSWNRVMQLRSN